MATDDKAERDTPRSTWSGMWAVATVIGIGLSIISASKLAFMWLTIGPAPVVANVFEFYSTVVHTIFDPLLPLLQWLDWSWVNWFVAIPYWRDIVALYLLFGAVNYRAFPWVRWVLDRGREIERTAGIDGFIEMSVVLVLPVFLIVWPVAVLVSLPLWMLQGLQEGRVYLRGFMRNTIIIIGGVILVIIGNAGLTAN